MLAIITVSPLCPSNNLMADDQMNGWINEWME
jgi:hypothetical protein